MYHCSLSLPSKLPRFVSLSLSLSAIPSPSIDPQNLFFDVFWRTPLVRGLIYLSAASLGFRWDVLAGLGFLSVFLSTFAASAVRRRSTIGFVDKRRLLLVRVYILGYRERVTFCPNCFFSEETGSLPCRWFRAGDVGGEFGLSFCLLFVLFFVFRPITLLLFVFPLFGTYLSLVSREIPFFSFLPPPLFF